MTATLQELYDKLVQAKAEVAKAEKERGEAMLALTQTPEHAAFAAANETLANLDRALSATKESEAIATASLSVLAKMHEAEAIDGELRAAAVAHYNATKEKSPVKGVSIQVRKRDIKVSIPDAEYMAWVNKNLPTAVNYSINADSVKAAIDNKIVEKPEWMTIKEFPSASITLPK